MARFTGTGQGAAAWTAQRRLPRSQAARVSGGSFSSRTNMVGTHWLWVTRCSPISRSACPASNRSMTTQVAPDRCDTTCSRPAGRRDTAAPGTGTRRLGQAEQVAEQCPGMSGCVPNGAPLTGRMIPFGRPVVPEL